jgi:formylglycine-generating enzyme required for sulfatase activity
VTQADVTHLQQARVETSIRAPLRSFKISDTPMTIGLYHAVMGHYPDLNLSNWPTNPGEREALRARWQANPDLPLTNTTLAEDQAFIAALNSRTGRHFRLPTESEVEYSIRGRAQGAITTTTYHFGNDENEVPNRAWVYGNSADQAHGVREPLPGRTLDDSRNSFGLIHAIGNVWVRSAEGVVRGGSFNGDHAFTQSFLRYVGYGVYRNAVFGARLVEDL